jgi:Protein of unknown function (DUF2946)
MVLPKLHRHRFWACSALQKIAATRRIVSPQPVAAFVALVLALNLLIPAIAGATVKRDQFASLFNIICTSAGLKVVTPDGGTSSSHGQQSSVHCPLCVLGGASPLPSHAVSFPAVFLATRTLPPVALESSIADVYWPSASPRGPPTTA